MHEPPCLELYAAGFTAAIGPARFSDTPHPLALRSRRERPRHRTTNRFNEIALPHVTLHSGAAENYLKDTTSGYGGVEYHRVS